MMKEILCVASERNAKLKYDQKKPVKIKCIKNCKALKIALSKAMLLEINDMRFKMANEMSIFELILNDYCFQLA